MILFINHLTFALIFINSPTYVFTDKMLMSSEITLFNEFNEKRFRRYGKLVGRVFVLGPFDSPIF